MARRHTPFAEATTVTWAAPPMREPPANLGNASMALYEVVRKLISNDGRMTSTDYAAAVAAVQLAENH